MNAICRVCGEVLLSTAAFVGPVWAMEAKSRSLGPTGWCCAECEVKPLAGDSCAAAEGEHFPDRLQAQKYCAARKGWCCGGGSLSATTRSECARKKGAFFCGKKEAEKKCVNSWDFGAGRGVY